MTRLELPRLEIALLTVALAVLLLTTGAKSQAQGFPVGPPIGEAHAISMEICRQAAALAYDAERLLCHCDDYDDVQDELRDVAEELDDLNCVLREAYRNPRRWHRVCKRAEDVVEEIEELDEEICEALNDLNRHRRRSGGRIGCELEHRVHAMGAMAVELHRLSHVR